MLISSFRVHTMTFTFTNKLQHNAQNSAKCNYIAPEHYSLFMAGSTKWPIDPN